MSATTAERARVRAQLETYKEHCGSLPPSKFIGSLAWFSISGTVERSDGSRSVVPVRVHPDWLREQFEELGLNEAFLPNQIKKINAFESASAAVSGYEYDFGDKQTAILMVRDVDANGEKVIRQVTLEKRDRRGAQLSYHKVAVLEFVQGSAAMRKSGGGTYKAHIMDGLGPLDRLHVEQFLSQLQAKFDDHAAVLQPNAIRAMVRDYLKKSLNAISVRESGGIYFLHREKQIELDCLATLVARIGQGCSLSQAPLVDTGEQREMLTDAFQDEVEEKVRLLMLDIQKANERGGPMSRRTYDSLMARWRDISDRSAEYSDKLGLAQERAGRALEFSLLAIDSAVAGKKVGKKAA